MHRTNGNSEPAGHDSADASLQRRPASGHPPPGGPDPIASRLADLVAAVAEPWESMRQTIDQRDQRDFGDPASPPSPAFHIRHTVEVFRLHARKAISAVGADTDALGIPPYDQPIPQGQAWSPGAAVEELERHVRVFAAELRRRPAHTLAYIAIEHGERFALADFIAMMTRHIVWHAAAAYYRAVQTPEP